MKKAIAILLAILLQCNCASAQSNTYQIVGNAGIPTLGSCGTGATLASGSTDWAGTINAGTGVFTTCTLNFSETFSKPPICQVTMSGLTVVVAVAPATTTSLVISTAVSLASGKFSYQCFVQSPAQ